MFRKRAKVIVSVDIKYTFFRVLDILSGFIIEYQVTSSSFPCFLYWAKGSTGFNNLVFFIPRITEL